MRMAKKETPDTRKGVSGSIRDLTDGPRRAMLTVRATTDAILPFAPIRCNSTASVQPASRLSRRTKPGAISGGAVGLFVVPASVYVTRPLTEVAGVKATAGSDQHQPSSPTSWGLGGALLRLFQPASTNNR